MEKIKETLWADYTKVSDLIQVSKPDTDDYKMLLEERDKIRNELIKLGQAEMDNEVKRSQIEAEDKREKTRNKITIGTFVVSTGLSLYAIMKTFRFDQDSTVTSTLGRSILNSIVPKGFKK